MLSEAADTNPTVPARTTATMRNAAVELLRNAHREWSNARTGDRPPAGGVVDERPTVPGLADAIRRLDHHVRMVEITLNETHRGPGKTTWGVVERLGLNDLERFIGAAAQLIFNTAAIVIETSNLTTTPATEDERKTVMGTRAEGTMYLNGIATTSAAIYEIATRLTTEVPLPAGKNSTIH